MNKEIEKEKSEQKLAIIEQMKDEAEEKIRGKAERVDELKKRLDQAEK